MPCRGFRLLAALFLLAPAGISAGVAGTDEAATVIGSVSFQVASPYMISYEELARIVPAQPGTRFTMEVVRESIRRLSRKTIFLELAAYVRGEGGRSTFCSICVPCPSSPRSR